jgi:hypothetical protein
MIYDLQASIDNNPTCSILVRNGDRPIDSLNNVISITCVLGRVVLSHCLTLGDTDGESVTSGWSERTAAEAYN